MDSQREDVVRIVERMKIPYEVVEIDGATAHAWNATSLPSTYIVDKDGRVVWSVRGAIDADLLERRLQAVLTR